MIFSFLYPSFLWAFALLAIPILIHLFNFRKYKEIYFPNTLFLKSIKEQSKSANQLKNLLILLFRLLLFSCLVLAFAMPFSSDDLHAKKEVSTLHAFYIDNSFSMNSSNENGNILVDAKKKVEELAKQFPASDQFLLTTNDFFGKHRRHLHLKEFLEELELVEESPISRKISEVYTRQLSDIGDEKSADLYWLSDFQKNILSGKEKADSLHTVYAIPMEPSIKNNLSIDSCWFESPVRKLQSAEELKVKITNYGDQNLENIPINLVINGQQKSFASININANSSIMTTLSYTLSNPGMYNAMVSIEDHPIVFDNHYYFTYDIRSKTKILELYSKEGKSAFQKVFKLDSSIVLERESVNQFDYSNLKQYNIIIVNEIEKYTSGLVQELQRASATGSSLFIIPAENMEGFEQLASSLKIDVLQSWDTSSSVVNKVNYESDFFQNVFTNSKIQSNEKLNLPYVKHHYKVNSDFIQGKDVLLTLANNDGYLIKYKTPYSSILMITSPLNEQHTNFEKNWLFPPVLYRTVLTSVLSEKIAMKLQPTLEIPVRNLSNHNSSNFFLKNKESEHALHLSKNSNTPYLFTSDWIKKDGVYDILQDQKTVNQLALNYDRSESQMYFYNEKEVTELLKNNTNTHVVSAADIKGSNSLDLLTRQDYWKYFIVLALLFLLAETILLRWWK